MDGRGSNGTCQALIRLSPSSQVTRQSLSLFSDSMRSRASRSVAGDWLDEKAVAELPATKAPSMRTFASRCRMSTALYGAELELSSLNVVSVHRMRVECSVRLSAMDAHGVERRALTFMARNMIFIHKLQYGVTKAHHHAENYSTLDSTLKNPSSVLRGTVWYKL